MIRFRIGDIERFDAGPGPSLAPSVVEVLDELHPGTDWSLDRTGYCVCIYDEKLKTKTVCSVSDLAVQRTGPNEGKLFELWTQTIRNGLRRLELQGGE